MQCVGAFSHHNRPLASYRGICNIPSGTFNAGEGRYRFLPRYGWGTS
jgi:hypothetical protein